ncbi:hypothetical protein BDK51DRAFT_48364 [Blyttiomyces helicus]|uniref:Uncharacterized protein n=1 Tax=Blyttiomyces helicus TaxID=388810 RepID=A0A4P9VXE8_9FUNG|nr:hypothetical protein BDK51DRAFT_48364 [Blyttiomyces helicus]|eukprot:RKO82970.1 hypothetical protein BDK51DRAFT_48364 [Blyttiomyces helicus]
MPAVAKTVRHALGLGFGGACSAYEISHVMWHFSSDETLYKKGLAPPLSPIRPAPADIHFSLPHTSLVTGCTAQALRRTRLFGTGILGWNRQSFVESGADTAASGRGNRVSPSRRRALAILANDSGSTIKFDGKEDHAAPILFGLFIHLRPFSLEGLKAIGHDLLLVDALLPSRPIVNTCTIGFITPCGKAISSSCSLLADLFLLFEN